MVLTSRFIESGIRGLIDVLALVGALPDLCGWSCLYSTGLLALWQARSTPE